jgi:HlyD family secretion protein
MPTATTSRSPHRTRALWIGAAIVLIGVFWVAHKATQTKLPVRIGEAQRGVFINSTSTNGKVEPQANFEAHAPFPGIIRQLYAREGDKVPQGKLLLSMDDTDARARLAAALAGLRGAQAGYDTASKGGSEVERLSFAGEVGRAQADRDQAQRDVAALEKLEATGAAAPSEVAAARQRLAADNSALQNLQARQGARIAPMDVAHAKALLDDAQAAYTAAQKSVDEANVRAPFAGTVYSLPVSRTEFVQQGDRLLQMADLSKIQVRAYFDEPEIGRLAIGQPIVIRWDAKPAQRWHGHILRVPSTIIGYLTRNVGEVLVSVDDADGTLLPSTNVTVTVTTANKPDALTIPREALHTEEGRTYVYTVANNTLRRTPVRVGETNLTQVEILSGLQEHQKVALGTTNGAPVIDGVPIRNAN